MQNRDKIKVILSINRDVFLYTLKQISIKNNTIGIPSPMGEFERGKILSSVSQITLTLLFIRFQDCIIVIMFMSSKILRQSPNFKEYFQSPYRRGYKECNRYRIAKITLERFGLIIDQGKLGLPKVWSNDTMNITTPNGTIENDADKPFCCTHCGSKNYIKYGKKNDKQVYIYKECNRRFVDNLFFERLKCNPKVICATLDLYFKGISLRKISDHLKQFYDLDIHFTTIYYWIKRYIEIMDVYVSQFKPKIGNGLAC